MNRLKWLTTKNEPEEEEKANSNFPFPIVGDKSLDLEAAETSFTAAQIEERVVYRDRPIPALPKWMRVICWASLWMLFAVCFPVVYALSYTRMLIFEGTPLLFQGLGDIMRDLLQKSILIAIAAILGFPVIVAICVCIVIFEEMKDLHKEFHLRNTLVGKFINHLGDVGNAIRETGNATG